jgi:hypothetical protein
MGIKMIDYLKLICDSLGIQLFYTNNKALVLSTDVKEDVPTLRAHKAFEFCPESVAKAVINYYIGDDDDKNTHEEKIIEYLKGDFDSITYESCDQTSYFKETIIKNINSEKKYYENDPSLVECEIITIVSKDFFGKETQYSDKEPLTLSNSNLLELEVNIKPLDT